jgi:hypothetical protein
MNTMGKKYRSDALAAVYETTLGYTAVIQSEQEFPGIEGLACENWLRSV